MHGHKARPCARGVRSAAASRGGCGKQGGAPSACAHTGSGPGSPRTRWGSHCAPTRPRRGRAAGGAPLGMGSTALPAAGCHVTCRDAGEQRPGEGRMQRQKCTSEGAKPPSDSDDALPTFRPLARPLPSSGGDASVVLQVRTSSTARQSAHAWQLRASGPPPPGWVPVCTAAALLVPVLRTRSTSAGVMLATRVELVAPRCGLACRSQRRAGAHGSVQQPVAACPVPGSRHASTAVTRTSHATLAVRRSLALRSSASAAAAPEVRVLRPGSPCLVLTLAHTPPGPGAGAC